MSRPQALREVLARLEPEREVWCLPGARPVCAGDVAQMLAAAQETVRACRCRRVALAVRSEDVLVQLLVLLDGTAREILLVPEAGNAERIAALLACAETEVLLTSGRDVDAQPGVKVLRVDERLLWNQLTEPTEVAGGVHVPQCEVVTRWVLPTSGTTGTPKLVAHTLASLTRSAKLDLSRGRDYRWGSLYNLTGFAGLQVFLQSWCGGSCLILSHADASLEQRVDDLIAGRCTALSATPTMWRKLLMATPVHQLPLRQITLGGEIVDQKILDALRATFPAAKIVHIYASTEAGVGFAVRDGLAGFPATYVEQCPGEERRVEHAGVGVRVRVDEEGHLLIRPDRDEQELRGGLAPLRRSDGFIDTGDLVVRRGDRYYFLGRASGLINVGGNKVHPEEVEDCLLSCADVLMARVTGRPSAFTGQLVQAEVVVDEACEENWEDVRRRVVAHCRARLESFKVPAVLKRVDQIEATASGKLKRGE